jgi:hypothetical protein
VASAKASAKTHSEELRAARAEAAFSKAEARGLVEKVSQLEKRAKVLLIFDFDCSSLHFGLVNVAVTLPPLQRVAGHLLVKGEFGMRWMADRGCKFACCAPVHGMSFKHQRPKVVRKTAGGLCRAHQGAPGRTGQGCACRGDAQSSSAGLQDC